MFALPAFVRMMPFVAMSFPYPPAFPMKTMFPRRVGEFVYGVCRDAQHPDIDEPLGAGIPVAHGAVGREFCAAVCGTQVQGADAQRCACAREGSGDVDRGVERFGIGQQAGYVGKEYFRGFQRAAELQCGHLQFLIFHGVCGCGFAQGQL